MLKQMPKEIWSVLARLCSSEVVPDYRYYLIFFLNLNFPEMKNWVSFGSFVNKKCGILEESVVLWKKWMMKHYEDTNNCFGQIQPLHIALQHNPNFCWIRQAVPTCTGSSASNGTATVLLRGRGDLPFLRGRAAAALIGLLRFWPPLHGNPGAKVLILQNCHSKLPLGRPQGLVLT